MPNSAILALIDSTPLSKNVVIFYPSKGLIKVVDMGDKYPSAKPKLTKKESNNQFRIGCMWVSDNTPTGESGFVRTPNGSIYEINNSNKSAKLVK